MISMPITREMPAPNGMYAVIVNITPDMAKEMLAGNLNNRFLRKHRVKQYARGMASGQWKLTPEGIIIATNGRILQGQHRLHAIILAGCPVQMMVTYNAPEDIYDVLDTCEPRNLADRVGADRESQRVTNAMIKGLDANYANGWTTRDSDEFYHNHREAIAWAIKVTATTHVGLRRPQLKAVIARAKYHVKEEVLMMFSDIVVNGSKSLTTVSPGARTALSLREHILKMRSGPGGTSSAKLYGIIERALRAFEQDKELKSELRPVPKELYPLPTDLTEQPAASGDVQ